MDSRITDTRVTDPYDVMCRIEDFISNPLDLYRVQFLREGKTSVEWVIRSNILASHSLNMEFSRP